MIFMIAFLMVLLFHWIADFVCQTDWQARNKSTNNRALLIHTTVYSVVMTLLVYIFLILPADKAILFGLVTFIAHTTQDYFTSRINSKLWKEGEVHYFFVSIGFDQFLHYLQLLLTITLI